MDYKPVVVQRHARTAPTKHNAESRYWRQFKYPVFIKEYAPVTSVHFSPTKPHRYAVTAATRIQIYAPRTQKVTKTISRFKDVARSGCIRGDGKLVVAGDDTGLIQVSHISFTIRTGFEIVDRNLIECLNVPLYRADGISTFPRSLTLTRVLSSEPWTRINSLSMLRNSLPRTTHKSYHVQTILL